MRSETRAVTLPSLAFAVSVLVLDAALAAPSVAGGVCSPATSLPSTSLFGAHDRRRGAVRRGNRADSDQWTTEEFFELPTAPSVADRDGQQQFR